MLWETYENPESNLSGNLVVTNDETVFGQTISGDVGFFGSLYSLSTANQYHPFAQMQIGANFWGTSGATGLSGATTADVKCGES